MTPFTLGRSFFLCFMAAFAVCMSRALEVFDFFVGDTAVMTGLAFFDFLAFYIGYLSAVSVFAVVTLSACNVFLMLGMIKLNRFFSACAQSDVSRTIVGHGGNAEAHQKSQSCCTDNGFLNHFFPLIEKNY